MAVRPALEMEMGFYKPVLIGVGQGADSDAAYIFLSMKPFLRVIHRILMSRVKDQFWM